MRSLDLDADTQTHYRLRLERPHGEHVVLVSSESSTTGPSGASSSRTSCSSATRPMPTTHAWSWLLGDRADDVEFVPLDSGNLTGAERGRWAAERAAAGF